MSERDRYALATAYYGDLRDHQDLPADQPEWSDVDDAYPHPARTVPGACG